MKRSSFIMVMLALLLLTACQPAPQTNNQACGSVLSAAQALNRTKAAVTGAKPVLVVHQVRESILSARREIAKARTFDAAAVNSDDVRQLERNLDGMDAVLLGVADSVLVSQVREKLAGPAVSAADSATALYNARCVAQ